MSGRSWIGWIAATLVIAVGVHVASMRYLPHFIMRVALAHMGTPNAIHHGRRAEASSHGVVRPSPDLLYSVCPFDLAKGPLLVTAPVPAGTYWSVSVFDADTNNIFALNDRQAKEKRVSILVSPPPGPYVPPANTTLVVSPTARGLVLFRTLIDSEKDFARIDRMRREATCALLNKR
jgi:uncharacterized membrane protein